ncbi:MAG: hypothetical protein A2Y57_02350 [Candidatus Woykebacteria bacterium RBG_13_40_7b]|uniref:Uncharacterized protein n=1 Tax=Candidatus Woykebacteria bacterium RBG_13_40_7b TaxID=1802594 RepID=A0A1G1WCA6_9BACT|nr:MAG: hypothetical protein A2Y57_02350 [Candidatus Woykebacteria bacterium RBG_13_40_7b]
MRCTEKWESRQIGKGRREMSGNSGQEIIISASGEINVDKAIAALCAVKNFKDAINGPFIGQAVVSRLEMDPTLFNFLLVISVPDGGDFAARVQYVTMGGELLVLDGSKPERYASTKFDEGPLADQLTNSLLAAARITIAVRRAKLQKQRGALGKLEAHVTEEYKQRNLIERMELEKPIRQLLEEYGEPLVEIGPGE